MAVMEATEVVLDRMAIDKGGRGGLVVSARLMPSYPPLRQVNTASLAGLVAGFNQESMRWLPSTHPPVLQLLRVQARSGQHDPHPRQQGRLQGDRGQGSP
jgi:hypothetical protein